MKPPTPQMPSVQGALAIRFVPGADANHFEIVATLLLPPRRPDILKATAEVRLELQILPATTEGEIRQWLLRTIPELFAAPPAAP